MENQGSGQFNEHFGDLPDPRIERTKRHKLIDIVVIAICAVICGADDWVEVELFGESKESWFRTFLELPHGIPSHDTFTRVFARLDPDAFRLRFVEWVQVVSQITGGQVIAIDGKKMRGSAEPILGHGAIDMVSAWATENHLVLGQVKVADKSNEITAIPQLLQVLELAGCLVTIDAIGCQKEIAQTIVDQKADYLLEVKENQGICTRISRKPLRERRKWPFGRCRTATTKLWMAIMAGSKRGNAGQFPTPNICTTCAAMPTGRNCTPS